jgi:aminoglycoside phosphotransferase (APT) family kinase protein
VLKALSGGPVPVPQPLLHCANPAVIGSEFYVMDYVGGRVFWDPALPDVDVAMRARIYDEMNRVLAALHQLDPAALGLADYGRPGRYFERQIRRWTDQYRASETERRPDVERLIEWLPRSLPPDDGQASLVHGDFRLDNMIFDEAGQVMALLDWELSTLGHPYADLAYQCAQWRLPAGALRGLKGVDREALGVPSENAYVAAYLGRRGLPSGITAWEFYLVLSLFRLAAICQGVYRRGLAGNASSTAALEFGPKVDAIASEAAAIMDAADH